MSSCRLTLMPHLLSLGTEINQRRGTWFISSLQSLFGGWGGDVFIGLKRKVFSATDDLSNLYLGWDSGNVLSLDTLIFLFLFQLSSK